MHMKKSHLLGLMWWLSMMFGSPNASAQVSCFHNKTTSDLQQVLVEKNISDMSNEELQSWLLSYINEIRKKHGLEKIALYKSDIEQKHSEYLLKTKQDLSLWHEDHFDAEGRSFYTRAESAKIPLDKNCRWTCKIVWENIVWTNMTIKEAVELWMCSPDHAANILCDSFDHIVVWRHPWSNALVVGFVNITE